MKHTRFSTRLITATFASVLAAGILHADFAAPIPESAAQDPFSYSQFAATAWAANFTQEADRFTRHMHEYKAAFDQRDQSKTKQAVQHITDDLQLIAYEQNIELPKVLANLPAQERPKFQALVGRLCNRLAEVN